jgi:hypothetical protein
MSNYIGKNDIGAARQLTQSPGLEAQFTPVKPKKKGNLMANEQFDWRAFHSLLDTAIAIMITERGHAGLPYLPSKMTLMEFLEYSNYKRNNPAP